MNFNQHFELEGKHSFLSASSSAWVNYDLEKLEQRFRTSKAKEMGTRLHAFAEEAINLKMRMPRNNITINKYINDAIGYRMSTEVVLFYSEHAFGTVDAISFNNKLLRIHDLKTGVTPVNERQLKVYAAYFCLEYDINPEEINYDLRIYQHDQIYNVEVDINEILDIMSTIILHDKHIKKIELEG